MVTDLENLKDPEAGWHLVFITHLIVKGIMEKEKFLGTC